MTIDPSFLEDIKLLVGKLPDRRVASIFSAKPKEVREIREELGIDPYTEGASPKDEIDVFEKYNTKYPGIFDKVLIWTTPKVARHYGITESTVLNVLRRAFPTAPVSANRTHLDYEAYQKALKLSNDHVSHANAYRRMQKVYPNIHNIIVACYRQEHDLHTTAEILTGDIDISLPQAYKAVSLANLSRSMDNLVEDF